MKIRKQLISSVLGLMLVNITSYALNLQLIKVKSDLKEFNDTEFKTKNTNTPPAKKTNTNR